MHRYLRPLLPATLLLLTGCGSLLSVYADRFQCPIPKGEGRCQSLQQSYITATTRPPIPPPPDPDRLAPPATGGEWVPPVKTIWIAPYVDTAGRRHEPSLLRVVVFPGRSTLKPEPELLIPPVPETDTDGSTSGPPAPPAEFGEKTPRPGVGPPAFGQPSDRQTKPKPWQRPPLGTVAPQAPAGGFGVPGF
jgi:hypothetical protein